MRRDEGRRRRRWSAAACEARYGGVARGVEGVSSVRASRGASSRPRGAECVRRNLREPPKVPAGEAGSRWEKKLTGARSMRPFRENRFHRACRSTHPIGRGSSASACWRSLAQSPLPLCSGATSRSTTARVVGVVERAAARRTVEALGNHVLRREGASRSSARAPSVPDAHPNPARCRSVARWPTFQTVDVESRDPRTPAPSPPHL